MGKGSIMNIYMKIVELRKEVEYLQKNSQDRQGVTSSNVLCKLRPKMDSLNLVLVPSVTGHATFPKKTYGKEDSKELFTEITMNFTLINGDNPEEKITADWYSQGIDMGEKGIGKALTYGEKYFLLKLLQIPTDSDDPDTFAAKNTELINKIQSAAIIKKCNEYGLVDKQVTDFTRFWNISSKTTTKEEARQFLDDIDKKLMDYKAKISESQQGKTYE